MLFAIKVLRDLLSHVYISGEEISDETWESIESLLNTIDEIKGGA